MLSFQYEKKGSIQNKNLKCRTGKTKGRGWGRQRGGERNSKRKRLGVSKRQRVSLSPLWRNDPNIYMVIHTFLCVHSRTGFLLRKDRGRAGLSGGFRDQR